MKSKEELIKDAQKDSDLRALKKLEAAATSFALSLPHEGSRLWELLGEKCPWKIPAAAHFAWNVADRAKEGYTRKFMEGKD